MGVSTVINVENALRKFRIDPSLGSNRAIMAVGELISESQDPHSTALSVIRELGGQELGDFPSARIAAKALVQRAVEDKGDFSPVKAMEFAKEKIEKLRNTVPEAFCLTKKESQSTTAVSENSEKPKKVRSQSGKRGRPATKMKDGMSLKDRALAICAMNASLANGALSKLISQELSISYSNSFYYVSRVWKRPSGV
jgi:hypothetical protein